MSDRKLITDHLICRWLERVEKYDLSVIRDAMPRAGYDPYSERDMVAFIETYFDVDVSNLRRELMGVVAPALRMRAKGVRYRGYFIPLKNGIAATVLDRGMWRHR